MNGGSEKRRRVLRQKFTRSLTKDIVRKFDEDGEKSHRDGLGIFDWTLRTNCFSESLVGLSSDASVFLLEVTIPSFPSVEIWSKDSQYQTKRRIAKYWLSIWNDEWVSSNQILVFAQRFLESSRGKHCKYCLCTLSWETVNVAESPSPNLNVREENGTRWLLTRSWVEVSLCLVKKSTPSTWFSLKRRA